MKTKLLSCILLSAMALGATQAFAQKLDAPVAAKEDLMTFAGVEYQVSVDDKVVDIAKSQVGNGVEYQVSVDDKGEKTYTILDSSKEGAQEIYQAAVEENNRRIDQLWEKNALSQFAEKEKLAIDFENSQYSLVQFNCKLTGLTVDELSAKLRHQVIQKTDKDHRHDWMYFDVTDEDGNEKLFRYCQIRQTVIALIGICQFHVQHSFIL